MLRDFTYVDDVTEALVRLIDRAPQGEQQRLGEAPGPGIKHRAMAHLQYRQQQAGGVAACASQLLEQELGRKATKELMPMQPGDVPATYADVDDLVRDVDFRPATSIEEGIRRFAALVSRLLRGLAGKERVRFKPLPGRARRRGRNW